MHVEAIVGAYAGGARYLADNLVVLIAPIDATAMTSRADALRADGVSASLANRIAGLPVLAAGCHIVHASQINGWTVEQVARTYFALGARLDLDWLRSQAEALRPETSWEQKALSAIVEDLYSQQQALASCVLQETKGTTASGMIDIWIDANRNLVDRSNNLIGEFKTAGGVDIARLAIANRQVRAMIVGVG